MKKYDKFTSIHQILLQRYHNLLQKYQPDYTTIIVERNLKNCASIQLLTCFYISDVLKCGHFWYHLYKHITKK